MLQHYDAIRDVILPTLGPERRATYSPFLPISPVTGQVLQVPIIDRDTASGTVFYKEPVTGRLTQVPVTSGHCKLQWKADWAMRWAALGVDYEMAGKDLIDSVRLAGHICRILGAQQPEGFNYELFLDEKGEKISKSRGNGLTIDEWLTYASPESLSLYMYQSPRKAKRLYFDVIPRAVDEYVGHLAAYPKEEQDAKLMNPVWHIHSGEPPKAELPISFALLLNLASASNSEDKEVLWGFIRRYTPDATPEQHPLLDQLVGYAIRYFHDFVKPAKSYRAPDKRERAALLDLDARLGQLPPGVLAEEIQAVVYAVGKEHGFEPLRAWFSALYEVLLGQTQGPALRLLRRALRHPRNEGAHSVRVSGLSGPALLRIRLAVRPPSPRAIRLVRIGSARKLSGSRWRFDRRANGIDAQHVAGDGVHLGFAAGRGGGRGWVAFACCHGASERRHRGKARREGKPGQNLSRHVPHVPTP